MNTQKFEITYLNETMFYLYLQCKFQTEMEHVFNLCEMEYENIPHLFNACNVAQSHLIRTDAATLGKIFDKPYSLLKTKTVATILFGKL